MPYLFLVSIGPVQGFIASARRTRDLAFGSWLLSELAKAAAQKIAEMNGIESLIFPAPQNKEELEPATRLNVANKIVAIIQQSPQAMGKEVREAINGKGSTNEANDARKGRLETIKNWVYAGMEDYDKQIAEAQIADLVEYSWVAVPYDGNNYEEKRKILQALMDARKNTRDFGQVEWGKNTPKSSIDGQLESVGTAALTGGKES